jgi:hypothetical protein
MGVTFGVCAAINFALKLAGGSLIIFTQLYVHVRVCVCVCL